MDNKQTLLARRLRRALAGTALAGWLSACGGVPELPGDDTRREDAPIPMAQTDENRNDNPDDAAAPALDRSEPARTLALGDVLGSWTAEGEVCEPEAAGLVEIGRERFTAFGEECAINDFIQGGDGFTTSLTCEKGDIDDPALVKLTPEGDALVLSWIGRETPNLRLVRCES